MKENKNLEWKEKMTPQYLKTVSAFSNYEGGIIVFGMNDQGKVVPLSNPEELCLNIENQINDNIHPQPEYSLEVLENATIELHVQKGEHTPYRYKGKAYKRNDTATIEVDDLELSRLILEGKNLEFEELPSQKEDLTFSTLAEYLRQTLGIQEMNENVLKSLELYDKHQKYNLAAEILADRNTFPGIDVAVFGKDENIIWKRVSFVNQSILLQYDQVAQIYKEQYQYETITGFEREKIELVPEVAFREAIANALIHRVWDSKRNIQVSMFEDRIEILSPGGLPSEITKEEFLGKHGSVMRNRILGNIFFRLKLVEIFGTGIYRIRQAYENSITQPTFLISEHSILIALPLFKDHIELSEDESIICEQLSPTRIHTMSQIMKISPFSRTKTRTILNHLIEKNIVEKTGVGRSTGYLLSKSITSSI